MKGKSDQELIWLLQQWAVNHGETPSRRQLNADVSMPSDGLYRKRFGSYGKALVMAGLEIKKPIPGPVCRQRMIESHRGKTSMAWKGGRIIDGNGYVLVWNPDHPNARSGRRKAYVAEHRMVMSDFLGRPLNDYETVHHKNGNRLDNRIENLELWSTNHPSGQKVEDIIHWAIEFLNIYGYNIHENPELVAKA